MKVVVVTTALTGGGAEFVAGAWAGWLARAGHDVRVLTTSRSEPHTLDGGARVRPLNGSGHLETVRALRDELTESPADVVLALQSYPNLIAIAAVERMHPAPALIVSERNITSRENEPVPPIERIKMRLAQRLYRRADLAIAVSHSVGAQLVGAYGMRGGTVVVVPNPAARDREARQPAPPAEDGEPLHLVLPMRLVPQKRIELAIEAAALLRSEGVDARLVCFGQGPGLEAFQKTANRAGVPLTVPGWSKNWVDGAPAGSVAVLPSYREGFGNVLVEAAVGGIPSVAVSNAYGVSDALVPTVTGELAFAGTPRAVADAVLKARASSMRHTKAWSSHFSSDESGRLLTAALQKAIKNRSARS